MIDQETHKVVLIDESVLGKNQAIADKLRARFKDSGTFVVNIMSSPGSGKTALLEATLGQFAGNHACAVIVGDCATDNDAKRLSGHGAQIVQIMTGGYCHLDASMIENALDEIETDSLDILFIENVGNLVCPSSFDLGEDVRVVLISVTEGEDKPLKYPSIFARADIVLVNKIDIAKAVAWDEVAGEKAILDTAPNVPILLVSARTGEGLHAWCNWLESKRSDKVECSVESKATCV